MKQHFIPDQFANHTSSDIIMCRARSLYAIASQIMTTSPLEALPSGQELGNKISDLHIVRIRRRLIGCIYRINMDQPMTRSEWVPVEHTYCCACLIS